MKKEICMVKTHIEDSKEDKKMTKRECIDFIVTQINKAQERFTEDWKSTGHPHNEIKHENYLFCKKICAQNGYVDGAFKKLWETAVNLNGGKELEYLEATIRERNTQACYNDINENKQPRSRPGCTD